VRGPSVGCRRPLRGGHATRTRAHKGAALPRGEATWRQGPLEDEQGPAQSRCRSTELAAVSAAWWGRDRVAPSTAFWAEGGVVRTGRHPATLYLPAAFRVVATGSARCRSHSRLPVPLRDRFEDALAGAGEVDPLSWGIHDSDSTSRWPREDDSPGGMLRRRRGTVTCVPRSVRDGPFY
jgi:hypothetical protein